jgi:hypothetical protein
MTLWSVEGAVDAILCVVIACQLQKYLFHEAASFEV